MAFWFWSGLLDWHDGMNDTDWTDMDLDWIGQDI